MVGRMRKLALAAVALPLMFGLSQCDNGLLGSVKRSVKTVAVLSPNGGEVLVPGTQATISWEASFDEALSIELFKGGAFHSSLAAGVPNTGSYDWQIPAGQTTGQDFRLRLCSTEDPEILDDSDGPFTISKLSVTSPGGGDVFGVGEDLSITWAGELDSANTINLKLYKNSVWQQDIDSGQLNDGTYSWALPGSLANGNDYTIRVQNTATTDSVDSAPFVIVSSVAVTAPNGGEVFVAGAGNTVTWQPDYAGPVSIQLLDGGSPVATLAASASAGSFTWSTPALTYAGTAFTVRVTTATAQAKSDDSNAGFAILTAPQNLVAADATTYADGISLSWDAVPGATSYEIHHAASASGPYSYDSWVSGITAELYPLDWPPTIHYYKVKAVRSGVSSLLSGYGAGSRNPFEFQWYFGVTGTGNGQLDSPTDIDVNLYPNPAQPEMSTLYVTDSTNNRVQWFNYAGTYLGKWGSAGSGDGQFSTPQGLCVDRDADRVYVADMGNHRLQLFSLSGTFISWWGKDTTMGVGVHSPGTATQPVSGSGDGEFKWPWDVAVDSSFVYVVDSENNRVQKFSKAGAFQGWWGKDSVAGTGWHPPGTASNPVSGTGIGEFWWPEGITVDADGSVYVAGPVNAIQKFTSGGTYLLSISAAVKKVSYDQDGHLYAAYGTGLSMHDPSGVLLGQFGTGGSGNGQFAMASGICVIPNFMPALGNIYVADTNNDRIQVLWRRK